MYIHFEFEFKIFNVIFVAQSGVLYTCALQIPCNNNSFKKY